MSSEVSVGFESDRVRSFHSRYSSFGSKIRALLFTIHVLQIAGFVLRGVSFHRIFDPSPLFDIVNVAFYDDFYPSVRIPVFVIGLLLVFISLLSYLLFDKNVFNNLGSLPVLQKLLSYLLHLLSSVFFIPFASLFLSFVPCGRSEDVEGLTFSEGLTNCSSNITMALQILALFGFVLLTCLSLLWHCVLDGHEDPTSRKKHSRSHNHAHFIFVLSQSMFVFVFFILHTRIWLFRTIFLFSSLLTFFSFLYFLPYFHKRTNVLAIGVLGLWTGSAVVLIIRSILDLTMNDSVVVESLLMSSIVVYCICTLFIIFSLAAVIYRYKLMNTHLERFHDHFVTSKVIVDNAIVDSFDLSTLDFDRFKTPYSVDILSRCIFPKPNQSHYCSTIRLLNTIAQSQQPDSFFTIYIKTKFELFISKDVHESTVSLNLLKNLDMDLRYDQNYLINELLHQLEILRRQKSTGQNVDSSNFIRIQRQQKQLTTLHQECLSGLFNFWKTLSADNVDLNTLPPLLKKVQRKKTDAHSLFQRLLSTQEGDRHSLLSSYANFVRDVDCDEERAVWLEDQVEMLSSEKSSSKGSSLASSFKAASTRNTSKRLKSLAILNDNAQEKKHRSAIGLLRFSVVVAFLTLFAISVVSYFISSSVLNRVSDSMDQIVEISHAKYTGSDLALLSSRSYFDLVSEQRCFPSSLDHAHPQANHLNFHLRRLSLPFNYEPVSYCPRAGDREIEPPSEQFQASLFDAQYPLIIEQSAVPIVIRSDILSAFALGLRHSLESVLFAEKIINNENVSSVDLGNVRSLYSAFENAIRAQSSILIMETLDFFDFSFTLMILFTVLVCFIIVFIALGLFKRSLTKISNERSEIINLFLHIPKAEILLILQDPKFKKRKQKGVSLSQTEIFDDSDSEYETIMKDGEKSENDGNLQKFAEEHDLCVDMEDSDSSTPIETTVVPLGMRALVFLMVTFIVFVLIYIYISLISVHQNLHSSQEILESSLEIRDLSMDITSIDRMRATYAQLYSYFGDEYFLNRYIQIRNGVDREDYVNQMLFLQLSNEHLLAISTSTTMIQTMIYLEDISLTLSTFAFEPDVSLAQRWTDFDYDINNEDFRLENRLRYPDMNWYSNKSTDTSKDHGEMLSLSRDVIMSPHYLDVLRDMFDSLDGTADSLMEIYQDRINQIIESVNLEWIFLFIKSSIALVFCSVLSFVSYHFRSRLRKMQIVPTFFFGLSVFLLLLLLFFLYNSRNNDAEDFENLSDQIFDVFRSLLQLEASFQIVFRRTISQPFEDSIAEWSRGYSNRMSAFSLLEDLLANQIVSHPELQPLSNRLKQQLEPIPELMDEFIFYCDVANSLSLTAYSTLPPELESFSWDMSNTTNGSKLILPGGLELTNSHDDLNQNPEELIELASAVVSSRHFVSLGYQILDVFSILDHLVMEEQINIQNSVLDYNANEFIVILSVLIGIGISLLIALCIILVAGSPSHKLAEHVKQKVNCHHLASYTKKYAVSLAVIFLFYHFSTLVLYSLLFISEGFLPCCYKMVKEWRWFCKQQKNYVFQLWMSLTLNTMYKMLSILLTRLWVFIINFCWTAATLTKI
ncbi:hypothetical protein P9112_006387 [Eukaryota sp. TZLM1-RC]